MSNQSYITVDGTLSDSVVEYASVLDFHNKELNFVEKTHSFEQKVEEEQEEEEEIVYDDQLFSEIGETYKYLATLPDREFESSANLAIYILSFSKDFESLLLPFLNNLIKEFQFNDLSNKIIKNKKRAFKCVSVISLLSNIFNSNDLITQSLKIKIFDLILNLFTVLNDSELLLPVVDKFESIIDFTEGDDEEIRKVLIKFANLIKSIDELKALKLYELALYKVQSSASSELIEEYLIESLNSSKSIDLSSIISQSKFEVPSSYLTLIKDYLSLSPKEFQQKSYNLSSLDFKQISKKNQYINLSKIALKSSKLKFSEISEELNLPIDQVELFIIDLIKFKVIQGKISQVEESLIVYKVLLIIKDIQLSDWLEIKSTLVDWRNRLKDVRSLVEQAQKKKVVKA